MNINSFKPIIDENSKIIILGSIPSVKSLKNNEYYGNPRNQFWKLIYSIFNEEMENEYSKRIDYILRHKIALWDVISNCFRPGSLDTSIRNASINDFETLFKEHPNIKYIFFNGAKAENLFMKNIDRKQIEDKLLFKLPSSSPARAIPLQEKIKYWKKLKECI